VLLHIPRASASEAAAIINPMAVPGPLKAATAMPLANTQRIDWEGFLRQRKSIGACQSAIHASPWRTRPTRARSRRRQPRTTRNIQRGCKLRNPAGPRRPRYHRRRNRFGAGRSAAVKIDANAPLRSSEGSEARFTATTGRASLWLLDKSGRRSRDGREDWHQRGLARAIGAIGPRESKHAWLKTELHVTKRLDIS